jgi:methyl-accepting chemotaxis protein
MVDIAGSQSVELEQVEAVIDLLLDGRYLDVPPGECRLTQKLARLGEVMHNAAYAELQRVVAVSVNCNEAVTSTAEMMRAIREVDGRTNAISAASEEMVASVQEISRNSDDVAAEAEQAREAAQQAMGASDRAVRTMETITDAVEQAASKVESLAEASSQIGDIVQQIEAIAKQTNLLALNATIEAARAGEAGKGFAVVASEVKNLANQTARATVDIRSRIETLREEMDSIVVSMEEGAHAVEQGRTVIASTGEGMTDVLSRINMVTAKMHDVADILSQQMEASQEISLGITSIAQMSATNVHSVEALLDVMDQSDGLVSDAVQGLGDKQIKDFTILVAKSDHMIWRKKLSEMVAGRTRLNDKELADHHSCRLGKWYDALKDQGLTNHPAYLALAEPHKAVHAAGIEAAKRYNDGDLDGALACIREVSESSRDVLRLLDELAAR